MKYRETGISATRRTPPISENSKKRVAAFDPELLAAMLLDRVDKSERLDDLQMSCLMFCGTEDERFEGMKRFAEGNDRCDFVSIEGPDHIMTWVESAQVLPPVVEFLRTATATGGVS